MVKDGGTATQGGLNSLGLYGNGGTPLCITNSQTPAPFSGKYSQLCLGASQSAMYLMDNSYGGATHLPLNIVINGNTVLSATDSGVTCTGCGGGSGSVTSVGFSTPNGTLTLSGTNPITSAGVLAADIALGHANVWTATQTFPNGSIGNGELANSVITVNGTPCTLGASCTPSSAVSLVVGSTAITGGASGFVEYNNGGVLGEKPVTGSGNVVLATSPTLMTPALGTPSAAVLTNATGLPLTSGVTGVLPAASGGAGAVNGILKANGSGTVSAATSGGDYAPATSGSSILYGNGAGGFSNASIGSGLSFSGGTLSATPGSSIVVGSTAISGGTSGNIEFNNGGTLGEKSVTGTGNVVLATSPTLTTPALGTPSAIVLTSATGLPLTTGVTGVLPAANGGTGVNNGSNTLTLGAALTTTGAGAPTLAFPGSSFTYTYPGNTGTLAELGLAQTWTATQTFADGSAFSSTGLSLSKLLTTTSVQETSVALTGCNGSTATIDLSAATYFYCTVSTGATTFAGSNNAPSGKVSSFVLELTNGGSQTVTWMAGTKWPAGTAPTLTASGVDLLVCSTRDGAVTWRCIASELNSR